MLTPTRSSKETPSRSRSSSALISSIASCMPSAARTARSASSSCATGAPKIAITLSPMYLSTVAAVALDLLAQAPQAAVDEALDRLGVHALGHRGVAGEVGEQDGDLAALLGREVPSASCAASAPGGAAPASQRRAAGHAEAGLGRDGLAAGRAALLQRRAAGHAEARALGSFRPTALAHHASHAKDGTGCSSAAWRKSCRRARRARSWPRGRAWPAGSNPPRSARSSAPSPTSPGP